MTPQYLFWSRFLDCSILNYLNYAVEFKVKLFSGIVLTVFIVDNDRNATYKDNINAMTLSLFISKLCRRRTCNMLSVMSYAFIIMSAVVGKYLLIKFA